MLDESEPSPDPRTKAPGTGAAARAQESESRAGAHARVRYGGKKGGNGAMANDLSVQVAAARKGRRCR
jgi:hypothetical protein